MMEESASFRELEDGTTPANPLMPWTPEQLAHLPHDNAGTRLIASIWVMNVLALGFLTARVYCKFLRHRGLWWDDGILIASYVSANVGAISRRSRAYLNPPIDGRGILTFNDTAQYHHRNRPFDILGGFGLWISRLGLPSRATASNRRLAQGDQPLRHLLPNGSHLVQNELCPDAATVDRRLDEATGVVYHHLDEHRDGMQRSVYLGAMYPGFQVMGS